MAEHIKMTVAEAKQKAEGIRKVILDTYHNEVKPSPFFTELRAGTSITQTTPGLDQELVCLRPRSEHRDGDVPIINLSAFLNDTPIWKIALHKRSARSSRRRRSEATPACCRFSVRLSGFARKK